MTHPIFLIAYVTYFNLKVSFFHISTFKKYIYFVSWLLLLSGAT